MEYWKDGSIFALTAVVLALIAAIYTNWLTMGVAALTGLVSVLVQRRYRKSLPKN